jgi:hypothetical protein
MDVQAFFGIYTVARANLRGEGQALDRISTLERALSGLSSVWLLDSSGCLAPRLLLLPTAPSLYHSSVCYLYLVPRGLANESVSPIYPH